jgi:hypothetical protein
MRYPIAVLTLIVVLFAALSACEKQLEEMCIKTAQGNGLPADSARRACERF